MDHLIFNKILLKLFLFITSLKFSDAVDTLSPNETIGLGQTLVSQNQVFELGFFTPGAPPGNSFFGMWYKNTTRVVIWVANRNNPITDSQAIFTVSKNGNLSINRGGSLIWSSNPSGAASNPVLQLLDTGNLVIVDGAKHGYLWQSFDFPTDNWLPGMKLVDDSDNGVEKYLTSWRNFDDPSSGEYAYRIENQGLPELVVYKGATKKMFRTGTWNGEYFGGLPRLPYGSESDYYIRDERLIYIARPIVGTVFSRLTLEPSGLLLRYNMNGRKDAWNRVITYPRDQCDEYNNCGANALCSTETPHICQCFKGFAPKSQHEWDVQDWSSGCTRTTPLNCPVGDGFLEVRGVKYPDMLRILLNNSMSLDECKGECLRNCSCTACANAYISKGGSGCLMWYGELLDIRQFPEADDKQNIYIRTPASELDTTTNGEGEKEKERERGGKKLVVVFPVLGVVILALISGGVLFIIRRKRKASRSNDEDIELKIFRMETIMAATSNFSWKNMIGEGGFGPVYKGNLSAEGEIAVKRLSRTSQQGIEEFKNEVISIAKLQHRNLVRLLGCCIEEDERMLIYEYLQNKSLDYIVFDQNRRKLLTWPMRFDIIMGIARGLLYLHQDSRLKIIHRDLKTSNILLDRDLNPKISDFGLARIFGEGQSIATTRRVAGTYGYMAPEYAIYGKYSVKSDVFSFGVILLEIVSGRKNRCNDDHSLLGNAWFLWRDNNIIEAMDECLRDTFVESRVKRCIHVGLLCVQKFAQDRPEMSAVVFMLGNEEAIIPQPKEPGFFPEESSSRCERSATQEPMITVTYLEAR